MTRYLETLGFQALGLDFSEAAIERARDGTPAGSGVRFECADLADVPGLVEPGSLALVVCRLAAAFLDGALLVDRVRRWLAPDGVWTVVVPDPQRLDPVRRTGVPGDRRGESAARSRPAGMLGRADGYRWQVHRRPTREESACPPAPPFATARSTSPTPWNSTPHYAN